MRKERDRLLTIAAVLFGILAISNTARDPAPASHGIAFNVVYGIVAVGVSAGTAWLLARHRAALA